MSAPTSQVSSAENTIGTVGMNPALSDLLPVDVEFHVAALAQAPAVVRELDPHLVLAVEVSRSWP